MANEEKEIDTTELADVIISWKNECGEPQGGRMYVPIPRKEGDRGVRRDMYKTLIYTLINDYGYTEKMLKMQSVYNEVMKASINPKSDNRQTWKEMATMDWQDALWNFFRKKISIYDTSNDPAPPERPKYEKPAPPSTDVELQNPITAEDIAKHGFTETDYEVDEEFLKILQGTGDE